MNPPWLRVLAGAVELRVRVVPRASRDRIAGVAADRLRVQVSAPPVDGEANRAVLELLSRIAGVPVRAATLAAGTTGRSKTVNIATERPDEVAEKLQKAAAEAR